MKITTLLTTLALVATTAAATAVVTDWRKEYAAEASFGIDVAADALEAVERLGAKRLPQAMEASAAYWSAAKGTAFRSYQMARAEVDLAGDKVTRGQLEGLLLRTEALYSITKGFVDTQNAIGAALQGSGQLDRAYNVTMCQALLGGAEAKLFEARTLLANFLEVN
jgi:hypothetical protein